MKFLCLLLLTVMSLAAKNRLSETDARRFADLALAGLNREFPNKPGNVLRSPEDAKAPSQLTPVFFWPFRLAFVGAWSLDFGPSRPAFSKGEMESIGASGAGQEANPRGPRKRGDLLEKEPFL